ncbi:MAG: hypothetical protein OEL83_20825 [Desulforhopalus sp.]|nr:hypothetical protein [Desulforhopalus sp.]
MMQLPMVRVINNESGFVLVTALLVMMVLILFGTFALNTTTVELQIAGNDRVAKEDFFNQESCVATAKFRTVAWVTTAFLAGSDTVTFPPTVPITDVNANGIEDLSECIAPNGQIVGSFRARKNEETKTPVTTWSDLLRFGAAGDPAKHPANDFPPRLHIDKPNFIEEADFSQRKGDGQQDSEYRHLVVTSYAVVNDRTAIVQEGVARPIPVKK